MRGRPEERLSFPVIALSCLSQGLRWEGDFELPDFEVPVVVRDLGAVSGVADSTRRRRRVRYKSRVERM